RQLALELMPYGITVNGIRAGVTDTPALRRIPQFDQLIKAAVQRNPGGRMTRPEDVADALVVLATPNTHWMTGNIIGVDGGEVMGSKEVEGPPSPSPARTSRRSRATRPRSAPTAASPASPSDRPGSSCASASTAVASAAATSPSASTPPATSTRPATR